MRPEPAGRLAEVARGAAPGPVRTLVVLCPDWPAVAAGAVPDQPAVVVRANRVVAATPAARAEGVAVGQRRRQAQGACPETVVHDHDDGRDARAFEAVIAAVEAFAPRLELGAPGRVVLATRGPARYFGGDAALAGKVHEATEVVVAARGWPGQVRVGVADGPTAAHLAARSVGATGGVRLVPAGESRAFLAPQPVGVLDRPDLADLLVRLGLPTLGDVAALDPGDVLARFGTDGLRVHRLASGLDEHPPDARTPPPDLEVAAELEPPAMRVDVAAFTAKALADELQERLAVLALHCTRLVVTAETEHGEVHERLWSHEGAMAAGAIADRVRWQLDGWLNGPSAHRPTSGVALLRLVPDEVAPAHGRQLGLWGGDAGADERVQRAVARVQGLLGTDAVSVPEHVGGRGPGEQVVRVPAAAVDLSAPRPTAASPAVPAPWPGSIPAPPPALVHDPARPVDVLDGAGRRVGVSGRGLLSAEPAEVVEPVAGGPEAEGRPARGEVGDPVRPAGGDPAALAASEVGAGAVPAATAVVAWAGPWPADERWWDAVGHRRRARLQAVLRDGRAVLLCLEDGRWSIEATYD